MVSNIIDAARARLILASDWLGPAFGRLEAVEKPGLARPGTDGARFFYDPGGDADLAVALAHSVAHCLLGHIHGRVVDSLAADMAAALLLDALLPDFCPVRGDELFRQARHRLASVSLEAVPKAMGEDPYFAENRGALSALLTVDDHGFWTLDNPMQPKAGGDGWSSLGKQALGAVHARRMGRNPGGEVRRYVPGRAVSRSYKALLSRYAETRELCREDIDTFEPGLYAHGLSLYGNLPIVEPSETTEARYVDELAVVIDTSGSCMRELTARFLDETAALVRDRSLFAPRFNLRILQCDAKVQRDDHITNLRDFERYIENLDLMGGGGTDFRPAFERIDRLVARGAFRRLPAAVFFSDGLGLFPAARPDYDVVFAGFSGRFDNVGVPGWVQYLELEDVT